MLQTTGECICLGQPMVDCVLCGAVRMPHTGACMVGSLLLNFCLLSYVLSLPQLAYLLSHMLLAIDAQSTGWKESLFQDVWHLSCADSFLVLHCGLLKMSHFCCI